MIMELQNIHEDFLTTQQRGIEFTSLEQQVMDDHEFVLERVNMHLDNMLNKANKDNTLLRHMARHYRAWNLSLRARIRSLKTKLKIGLESWLRLPWLNMALHREPLAQISKNLGQFCVFGNFLVKNGVFLLVRHAPARR